MRERCLSIAARLFHRLADPASERADVSGRDSPPPTEASGAGGWTPPEPSLCSGSDDPFKTG